MTQFVVDRCPAISTAAATALVFKPGVLNYSFGFAFGGLAVNVFPPAMVWATMKRVRRTATSTNQPAPPRRRRDQPRMSFTIITNPSSEPATPQPTPDRR